MEPIINPLWFYLIGTTSGITEFLTIVGSVLLGACFLISIFYSIDEGFNLEDKIWKKIRNTAIIGLMVFFISELIPSEDTCYKMIAASVVTPNNIETVGDTATDIIDYIVESVDKLIEEEENK